jgi:hypothetical protein
MEEYMKSYATYTNHIVYDFTLGAGGIGDCIKFFMFILETCMKTNTRLYYKKNNIEIEKYIRLKYEQMYINEHAIRKLKNVTVVAPYMYYDTVNFNYSIYINAVWYFSNEIRMNCISLFPLDITKYISIHVRLGDQHLETEKQYVVCDSDSRDISEERMCAFIEENRDRHIFFCCDNQAYKKKMKERYSNLIVTQCDIGHTSLSNTTPRQVLDGVTDLYILAHSEEIFAASVSGFSIIASKFNNIPLKT